MDIFSLASYIQLEFLSEPSQAPNLARPSISEMKVRIVSKSDQQGQKGKKGLHGQKGKWDRIRQKGQIGQKGQKGQIGQKGQKDQEGQKGQKASFSISEMKV